MTASSSPAPAAASREPPEAATEPRLATIVLFIVAFALAWALYFTITTAPLAIKHDMSEAHSWGREFQLGYNQHPPFWAWVCGLWFEVMPRTDWSFALLGGLNVAVGLVGVWLLLGRFAQGAERVAGFALLLVTPLYTFTSHNYDANIIFLSLWPWTLYAFFRSIDGGSIADSILFGLLAALAMLSKYYAAILLLTCFAAALLHPRRKAYFTSLAPYGAMAVATIVCAPHIWWLLNNRAPPLRYLAAISGHSANDTLGFVARVFSVDNAMTLPVFAVAAIVAGTGPRSWVASRRCLMSNTDFRILAVVSLLPLGLTLLSGGLLGTRITPEMTIATFPLLPLLFIRIAGGTDLARLQRWSLGLAALLTFGALAAAPVLALNSLRPRNFSSVAPYQEAAAKATRLWREKTGTPLTFVAGTEWYDNAIAFYSPDRPHSFVSFDYPGNLWVTPEKIAEHGLLSVCVEGDRRCHDLTAPFVTPASSVIVEPLTHSFWGYKAAPVGFIFTVIPPQTK